MSIDGPSEPLPTTGQPVGLPVADPSPAPRPGPVTLLGRFGSVEKLDPARWLGLGAWLDQFQAHVPPVVYTTYPPT